MSLAFVEACIEVTGAGTTKQSLSCRTQRYLEPHSPPTINETERSRIIHSARDRLSAKHNAI